VHLPWVAPAELKLPGISRNLPAPADLPLPNIIRFGRPSGRRRVELCCDSVGRMLASLGVQQFPILKGQLMTEIRMSTKILLLLAMCGLAAPLSSSAAVVNGDFETGNLAGWTLVGSGKATGSGIGVAPTEGVFQGYIETTGNFTALAPAVVASLGVPGSAIIGLGAGAPTNGTGISQDVTVLAGDTLTFDWNFLTDELNEAATYNDFGFFSISGSAFLLASRNSSIYNTVSPPAGFDGQTGWATQTYTFPAAGTYKIGFGVFNVGDSGHNSVLLLDAISIPVPEPTSIVLLAAGMSFGLLASATSNRVNSRRRRIRRELSTNA
jgi:hypothetical protein